MEHPIEEMIAKIGSDDDLRIDDDKEDYYGPEAALFEPKDTRVPQDEAESMADLLNGVLKYNPKERLSVAEILGHPWVLGRSPSQMGAKSAVPYASVAEQDQQVTWTRSQRRAHGHTPSLRASARN